MPQQAWAALALLCLGAGVLLAMMHDVRPWLVRRAASRRERRSSWLRWLDAHGGLTAYALLVASALFAVAWVVSSFYGIRG